MSGQDIAETDENVLQLSFEKSPGDGPAPAPPEEGSANEASTEQREPRHSAVFMAPSVSACDLSGLDVADPGNWLSNGARSNGVERAAGDTLSEATSAQMLREVRSASRRPQCTPTKATPFGSLRFGYRRPRVESFVSFAPMGFKYNPVKSPAKGSPFSMQPSA